MTDPSGSTSWTIDALGRVTSTVKTIGATNYTLSESYDLDGRRASLTYPDGEVVAYTYDASGCLATVGGYVTAATCTASMAPASRTLGNGVKDTYQYDLYRLWPTGDTVTTAAGAVLQSETYGHNLRGQISSKTSTDSADNWTYGYDSIGRLTTATNTSNAAYSDSFGYDSIGRMTSGTGIGALTYPATGKAHPHAPVTVGAASYIYDAAGNRTAAGTTGYGYDALERLASSTTGGVSTPYTYDGQDVGSSLATSPQ